MQEIIVETRVTSVSRLHQLLRDATTAGVEFRVDREADAARGVDPSVLVAIVGGISANLAALITGLLAIRTRANAKTIVLHGKSGRRLELNGEYSSAEIDKLVEAARQLDVERIVVDR